VAIVPLVAEDADELLSTSQAARVLGVSVCWVRRLTDSEALPAIRTPLGRLLPAAAVRELAERRRGQPGAGQPSARDREGAR
jgi:excisionase family DNA binding protein